MILNKVKWDLYYSKMDRSVLIFFTNNEKEVAINGFENKTICSGEVDGISV